MNYSSQLTFVPTLIYFIQAAGFLNYICILQISFYPFLVCFANRFVWAQNSNHNSWTSAGMRVCFVWEHLCAYACICMNVQVWVCYLNHLLAMLGCSFNTLHPNLIKSSMNSLQVHDIPCADRWSIAPRVCCQSDCPSVKRQKGTILVWNVLVPPRSLWARWIRHGSAHKNILQVHTHKRFVYFCTERSLASVFFPLALLLYILHFSGNSIWQALVNCCLGYSVSHYTDDENK